jgi:protoporphyrinogen/coproporphyrinogen III oxidase
MSGGRGIGVVGAGPAGLAAAWRLATRGHRVRLYESRAAGGRLRTEWVGGSGADAVVQLLSNGYGRALELAAAVGARRLVSPVPGQDALWREGRAHVIRYGSVRSMASSRALPAGLKLRLGFRYVPFLERYAGVLDMNAPYEAARAGLDGETIAEWGRRELGDDFVELMAYPLLAAYYGVTPEEAGAGVFHGLARAGMRVQLLGMRGGAAALAAAVAGWLEARGVEIRTGSRVESVEAGPTGVHLGLEGGAEDHEGVVVAVPAAEAARLVPTASWLAGIRSRSTATLVLATAGRVGDGWFGLSIPRRAGLGGGVAAVCVQEEKGLEGLGPAVVVVPAPEAADRWATGDAAAVLRSVLPVVETVLPGIRGRVVEARLVRLQETTFLPVPGHFARVHGAERDGVPARVALAGDYLVAPTVEGAVRSGLRAADRLTDGSG